MGIIMILRLRGTIGAVITRMRNPDSRLLRVLRAVSLVRGNQKVCSSGRSFTCALLLNHVFEAVAATRNVGRSPPEWSAKMAVPTITSISPSSGTTAGGNPVVIRGTNFNTPAVSSVTFDGNAASFTVNSDTQITATAPAHAAGSVTVTVTNGDGSATTTYTYTTGITLSPASGSSAGGTTVDIFGTNLSGTTAVKFGIKSALSFTQISGTHVQAVSPSGSGVVSVTITTPGGTSAPANYFYVNPPTKSSVSPSSGPTTGGTSVTITGTNLSNASSVTFGGVAGTITANAAGSITVTAPAGTAGNASIVVTTPGGTTDGLTFTYVATPTIASVTPTVGSTNGGDTVTITGTNLTTTQQVTFGGVPAAFGVIDDGTIAAITPPNAAGTVDVVVTTGGGSATSVGAFTYQAPPGG
ncbi:IPT/TIG domain-containing protein [Saccharopolyspora shandongensis]|uniref:IPT/TIG domain-containing protein n=1 Tax=Saccharopolyspora shandongensis TaxID=418495 RepID=UPI0033E4AF37